MSTNQPYEFGEPLRGPEPEKEEEAKAEGGEGGEPRKRKRRGFEDADPNAVSPFLLL